MSAALTVPQLYLDIAPGEGALARLKAGLMVARVEAVLLHPASSSVGSADTLADMVRTAQKGGAAALIAGDANLALELRADGAHLPWSRAIEDDYARARKALGSGQIVGVEVGNSRHDAMTIAEAGADYVAFSAAGGAPGEQMELLAWWSEIFEVPCVAMDVSDSQHALAAAQAGADFIGIALAAGMSPDAVGMHLLAIEDLLGRRGTR